RLAYADLLLRHGRAAETLDLLRDYPGMEPMLLRGAIAHRQLGDGGGTQSEALLADAFEVEARREEPVHQRELARFLLEVRHDARAALGAALENWRVQREPDDLLILVQAAQAAGQPQAARAARDFALRHRYQDARLAAGGGPA